MNEYPTDARNPFAAPRDPRADEKAQPDDSAHIGDEDDEPVDDPSGD